MKRFILAFILLLIPTFSFAQSACQRLDEGIKGIDEKVVAAHQKLITQVFRGAKAKAIIKVVDQLEPNSDIDTADNVTILTIKDHNVSVWIFSKGNCILHAFPVPVKYIQPVLEKALGRPV